jgi:hypothetical protein
LKTSADLAMKKALTQFWSSASLFMETPKIARERESRRGGNLMGQGPESKADVEESASRVPEWPLLSCLQCVWSSVVMLKNHSMSSTRAFSLDCFLQSAKLLTIVFSNDGQVPLKQFVMDNPLHIPPDAAPSAESHSCQNCLA